MFEKILSPSPQLLPICNFWKGGDFMEIETNPARDAAIEAAISRMEWEGGISPRQEVVPDERQDPTHPLRKGRSRIPTASAVAESTNSTG